MIGKCSKVKENSSFSVLGSQFYLVGNQIILVIFTSKSTFNLV